MDRRYLLSTFKETYPNFNIEDEKLTKLLDLCVEFILDEEMFNGTIFSNNIHHIPPVKTFAICYKDRLKDLLGKEVNEEVLRLRKRALGAFFASVFKSILDLKESKNVSISIKGDFEIKTASFFYKKLK